MISSRKRQLLIALILACICVPALATKPNEAKTEVEFEISGRNQLWVTAKNEPGRGPIKPTHMAKLYIQRPWPEFWFGRFGPEGIEKILSTPAGQSLSEQQQQFFTTSDALALLGIEDIKNHDMVLLYAVSQEEAKKTAQALFEASTNKAQERMQEVKDYLHELEEKIAKAKKELPEKEAEFEAVNVKYQKTKEQTHTLSSHEDAAEEAKQTILGMNKKLDALDIEIAGIEAKLSAIQEYKSKEKVSIEGLAKLEQILSEQTIELAGALARQKAAIKIRKREEEFYNLFSQWKEDNGRVHELRNELRSYEAELPRVKERLANPRPNMLPPKLYQNKVTIYSVLHPGDSLKTP